MDSEFPDPVIRLFAAGLIRLWPNFPLADGKDLMLPKTIWNGYEPPGVYRPKPFAADPEKNSHRRPNLVNAWYS
jgi:hypothetical protein